MPPRRSARASLPTPAQSSKAESVTSSSTPTAKSKGQSGLLTPVSMASGFEELPEDSFEDIITVADDIKHVKKEEQRFVLDSVVLPARRSKLATEKTTSVDNMTLSRPVTEAIKDEKITVEIPELPNNVFETKDDAKRTFHPNLNPDGTPSHHPFNIGKFSNVTKRSAADLALDSDDSLLSDDISVKPKRGKAKAAPKPKPAPKGRGRAKKVKEEIKSEDEESEFEDPADGDFALDSDQEAKQLKAALKESIGGTSNASSRASSSKPARGGATKTGRKTNATALRAAAARAAEKRATANGQDTPMSMDSSLPDPSFGEASPLTGVSTRAGSGATTPFNEMEFSDDSEDDFTSLSDDSEQPKKTKAKRGWGAGRKLDNGALEPGEVDPALLDDGDVDAYMMTLAIKRQKAREERYAREEKMAPIRKKENQLKKELGRKLTNGEKNLIRLQHHHTELENVWGDLQAKVEPVKPVPMEAHPSLKLTLLPFQKESLYWMKKQEEGTWKGGMLADEMGMGKTIQTIALLLSEPRRKPSLVVAPVVALMQWKHEIETHAEGFKVYLWHGSTKVKSSELKKYDVVLSSYGTLEAAFRRQQRGFKRGDHFIKEKSPMHDHTWFRVILDEAHNIKERSTNAAKAAFALTAEYKWCLSGTPLQNRVGELYSLVRFLGADPFSHYFCKKCDCKSLHWSFKDKRNCDQCGHKPMEHVCFWNTEILTPIAKYGISVGNPGHTAFKKLKVLLDRMMLRRTKLERADDLGLPPRTIVVRRDYFSPAEKELYMSLFTDAKRTFATYVDQGTVLNNYSNIFSLITRMRQMACHPDLVLRSKTSLLVKNQAEGTVCRLCNDQAEDAIMSQCKHVFDRECIKQYLDVQQNRKKAPECPVCHIEISIDLEGEAIDLEEAAARKGKQAKQGILSRLNLDNWRSSSKLEALVEELEKLRNKDCTIKSLVFSQFVSFLDLIAFRLQRAGFNICRLEGGMTPQQRDATIQHFMKNSEVTVFLISLKAGGVALNLTEASMVFMMDSWWNPSVEYQAMDRIHRLGQKRPVTVVKLVIEDSIEDQIVQLQAKKLAMTEAALSTDPDQALGKLTIEDLGFLFKL